LFNPWRIFNMKKTLVALAAAAATGAFAQVTLSGNLDVAYASSTGTVKNTNGNTFTTTNGTSSTTGIKLTATEDLGGGLKATAMYELDPRSLLNDSLGVTHYNTANGSTTTGSTASIASVVTGLSRHEYFVSLSGSFGTVKLGAPNSQSLAVSGISSPLGTGVGSAYTFNGGSGTNWSQFANTRYSRSVKYESPNINGFEVAIQYAPGNDRTNEANTSSVLTIPNARAATDIGVTYTNGGLKLAFATVNQQAQSNGMSYTGIAAANSDATVSNSYAASYNFGTISAHLGVASGNTVTATTVAIKGSAMRGAIKANLGKVDLTAQYTEVITNTGTSNANVSAKTTGFRADYNLSKTAATYLGYESYDSGATANNQQTIMSVGLRKSF
jgi:predicted porin